MRSDGGSRGNPGPAGAGFVIEVGGEVVCAAGRFLGSTTNNVAEYEALLWGLRNALALGHTRVQVYADSELLVKQLNGVYRVKNEGLKPLFLDAQALVRRFEAVTFTHVRREANEAADAMANAAMDARSIVGEPVCDPDDTESPTLFGRN